MSTSASRGSVVDVLALGVRIRVVVPDPSLVDAVRRAWHLCLLDRLDRPVAAAADWEQVPPERTVRLDPPGTGDARAHARALQSLTQSVTAAAIRAQVGRLLMFHAGGLADPRTGAAIAYAAAGGTGKTTLTRTLGPGLGYLTDETFAVRLDGSVVPYLKPLSVRRADGAKDEVPPGDLGLAPPPVPARIGALLSIHRDPGHRGVPAVERLGLLDAIATLSPEVSSLAALPRPLRSLADVVERAGGLLRVTYAEAESLRPVVRELLERAGEEQA
jgi:hypothetical protein